MELLHFNGPVWRPPFEATSQLLQVTAGCSHHRCKFCSLYGTQKFRMSPIEEIEADLKVIQVYQPRAHRVFLTGANPMVLTFNRLADIALLIRKYLRDGQPTIGCFARITDISRKTDEELRNLSQLGFDYISIGSESGDDDVLTRMDKGYLSADIVEQCHRLDDAGIHYNLTYLTGLAGHGLGNRNAMRTAHVFSQIHPASVNFVSLTLFQDSILYDEMKRGEYTPATEHERIDELVTLIQNLNCKTQLIGNTVSNPVTFTGGLPADRDLLIHDLQVAKAALSEDNLEQYRMNIKSL
jgi:radical SAM superfamily enzyme YgiQ (UPF0313 family)